MKKIRDKWYFGAIIIFADSHNWDYRKVYERIKNE